MARLDEAVRFLKEQREIEDPLDIIVMGVTEDATSSEGLAIVQQRAELGATWWLESITPFRAGAGYEDEWPVDLMRERILSGPPQL